MDRQQEGDLTLTTTTALDSGGRHAALNETYANLRITNNLPLSEQNTRNTTTAKPTNSSVASLLSTPLPPPTSSPTATENQPQHSRRLSFFNLLRRGEQPSAELVEAISGQPTSVPSTTNQDLLERAEAIQPYRQPMPLNHQEQQQQQQQQHTQFPPYSNAMQNGVRGYQGVPSRPISGLYPNPNNTIPDQPPGSYRLRSQSSKSSMQNKPSRSDSRGAATAMQAGVPTREGSHRDRNYNPTQQIPSGNAPLPPRRSSRGIGGHTSGQPAPNGIGTYGLESGPLPTSSEEWRERGATVALQQQGVDANGQPIMRPQKKGVSDFNFGRVLGEGSYSTVLAATDRTSLREYAVKILDKRHIIKEKKIKYVNIEKNTLNRLTEHPGIVKLYYTFQDQKSLYYVLDVASGGELLGVLKKIGTFDEECTRFYGAQILDAIDYMHSRGIIHRDLKPENVLLDDQMHVKITDFGTAKILPDPKEEGKGDGIPPGADPGQDDDSRATSFVGTAEYVSPELLTEKSACKASDLWAFGCIIYQLLSGRPPFKASNEYQTFQKIVALDYEFPPGFPPAARDLVERCLVLDPARRISIEHIKNHEFFDGIRWGDIWRKKAPRLKPYIPPPQEPNIIPLNNYTASTSTPEFAAASRTQQPIGQNQPVNGTSRPQPRVITELPPPTQLDIEWSPVLTRNNERILKLGNLVVTSTPNSHSPTSKNAEHESKNKLSRFFGGSTTKKRQRLVMVTSSARIILAAAGGDEKKTKSEISLLSSDCSWRTQVDSKGFASWCVDTRGTHFVFEDPKVSSTTGSSTQTSAEEWIESIERAKDLAISQSTTGSYSNEMEMGSSVSSPANSTLGGGSVYPEGFNVVDRNGRNHLSKSQASLGTEETAKRHHRFSKRQSKNGLAAVF